MSDLPSLLGAWRSFWARRAWDDRHRRLAALPTLAGWGRHDLRRLVAHGEEVLVPAGEVLLAEDLIGYWFVIVIEGALAVTRRARRLATLGPGGHVGDIAILGFGPQPATVTAATPSRLFIMGRRDLLSAVDASAPLRRLLFPDVAPAELRPHLRRLRADGTAAWRRLPPPARARASAPAGPMTALPGRVVRGSTGFARLAATAFGRGLRPPPAPAPAAGITTGSSRRLAVVVVVAASLAVAGPTAVLFHLPVVVVDGAVAVDISGDFAGGDSHQPVTGRYLLTAVDLRQPSLARLALARLRGDQLLPLADPDAGGAQAGRAAFAASQARAVALARATLGLAEDGDGVDPLVATVTRGVQGPSAALAYAVLTVDLLSEEDLARGRTIAATGSLDSNGAVGRIGFAAEKHAAAAAAGADILLVPAGQPVPGSTSSMVVVPVRSLDDAVRALRTAGAA